MKKLLFEGVATALVTPFDKNNKINYEELKRLIEYQINNGVKGLVVCGTTGEAATLTEEEKINLVKYVCRIVDRRISVIVGVGSNDTNKVIENCRIMEKIGVDGLLVVTPYYNKTTQKGLIKHYKTISKSTNLPIILYNVPTRTGINIEPETYLELSKVDNIVAVKESNASISKITKTRLLCGDNLHIYSGNDDNILPVLSLGGKGVISVLSNIFPKYGSKLVENFFDGNIVEASKMQIQSSKLVEDLFVEVNPIPIKEALNIIGFECGIPRMPLVRCSKKLKHELIKEIDILNKYKY